MSLYYITGAPGSGKSTIQKELQRCGYEAYDIDQPRFGGPVNLKTGEPTTVPPIEQRTKEWFANHEWRVLRPAVEQLKLQSRDKRVYLCGTATTEDLVWDLFDKVFYLNVDEATLRSRIDTRTDNDFGKTEHELALIIERYEQAQRKLKSLEVAVIDASETVEETVASIISETGSNI